MRKLRSGWSLLALFTAVLLLAQSAVLPAHALSVSIGGLKPESTQTGEDENTSQGGDQESSGDTVPGGSSGDIFDDGNEAEVVTYTNILPWGIAAMNTGEPLSEEELEEINDSLDYTNMGFCLSTYTRPEEIDWHQVFYNGAGIEEQAEGDLLDAYLEMVGRDELFGDLEVLKEENIEKYVKENTGTEYRAAQKSLYANGSWTYLSGYDAWCWEHGDTNLYPIKFIAGTRDGDICHLLYAGSDYSNYTSRNFVLTVKVDGNGKRTYISNLPADAPKPLTLAEIEFYREKDDALDALDGEPEDVIELEVKASDEPEDGWFWTVITAKEDIMLSVDRMDLDIDSRMFLTWNGVFAPDEWVRELPLEEGSSVLLYVNMPWNPDVRVSAWADDFYGEYIFGSDNWLHLDDPDTGLPITRSIVGHDMDAEGWGVNPNNRSELISLLKGGWIYFDPETGEPAAEISFDNYGYLTVKVIDGASCDYYGDFWVEYSHLYTGDTEVPDLLRVHAYGDARETLEDPSKYGGEDDPIGDYLVYAEQSIGAQKLVFTQANNGFAFMSDLLPGAEDETEFVFYRYRGAKTWKSAYKDKMKLAIREMVTPVEGEEDWEHFQRQVDYYFLYDIEKDGTPEMLIRRGGSEAGATLEIVTFDGQDALSCKTEEGWDRLGAGHTGYYTIPGRNGVLLWRGHMGYSEMCEVTLEYVDLTTEVVFTEDLNEKLQEDENAYYTLPDEVIPGSVELSMFYPQSLLPIDYYEFWSELSGEFDPTSPAVPTALDPADPYGAWIIRMASGAEEEASDEIPDWMKEVIEMDEWVMVSPMDSYMNNAGLIRFGDIFADGVLYPYTGGDLHDTHWYGADMDGDGVEEAICYLAESNNDGDSYRVIFKLEGNTSVTAYTGVNWSWGKSCVTEGGKLMSVDYPDSFRPQMVLTRRGKSFRFGVY